MKWWARIPIAERESIEQRVKDELTTGSVQGAIHKKALRMFLAGLKSKSKSDADG